MEGNETSDGFGSKGGAKTDGTVPSTFIPDGNSMLYQDYIQQCIVLAKLVDPQGPPKYHCQVHGPIYTRKVIGNSYFCPQCLGEYLTQQINLPEPEKEF